MMKSRPTFLATTIAMSSIVALLVLHPANADLVKMCLFYKAAGHARTDPILSQDCVS